MQFGFMAGNGMTVTKFVVRQMHEKFTAEGKKMCFDLV